MAFQFVPPFEEGDKQTNPETGVEYIFTSGAWRPLGPKIEDEFDTLDGRYVKLEDTTVLGDYYRLRGPNVAGNGLSTFQVIDEGLQKLYNVATPDKTNDAWVANVEFVNDTVSDYLPLTGGTIQGQLYFDVNSDGQHNIGITPHDADDTAVLYSMNGGICRLRSLADNNINSSNVRTHFGWGRNVDGDPETVLYHLQDPTEPLHAVNLQYLENYVANNAPTGDYIDKTDTNVVTTSWKISGNNKTFIQNSSNTLGLYNLKAPSESHHAARKQDVDNHKAKARTGTSSSPSLSTGELYYNTSTKQLFIGE